MIQKIFKWGSTKKFKLDSIKFFKFILFIKCLRLLLFSFWFINNLFTSTINIFKEHNKQVQEYSQNINKIINTFVLLYFLKGKYSSKFRKEYQSLGLPKVYFTILHQFFFQCLAIISKLQFQISNYDFQEHKRNYWVNFFTFIQVYNYCQQPQPIKKIDKNGNIFLRFIALLLGFQLEIILDLSNNVFYNYDC
ncbi:unnamed protein product [Paramecium sonneborni]|uniref:Transmembrane protein n=1 Tax=Paramecium sonneborni TaxID=65129 RepID=A0A8S1QSN6_9CILI|nr:unnamed protein product [Paramecium sonneborni]